MGRAIKRGKKGVHYSLPHPCNVHLSVGPPEKLQQLQSMKARSRELNTDGIKRKERGCINHDDVLCTVYHKAAVSKG